MGKSIGKNVKSKGEVGGGRKDYSQLRELVDMLRRLQMGQGERGLCRQALGQGWGVRAAGTAVISRDWFHKA